MIYRFGKYRYDVERELLVRAGSVIEVRAKTRSVLMHLVRNRHRVVSKAELLAAVWPGRRVETQGVFQSISELRAALGPPDPIRTVRGCGYQWALPTREVRTSRVPLGMRSRLKPIALAAVCTAAALVLATMARMPGGAGTAVEPVPATRYLQSARKLMGSGHLEEAERMVRHVLDQSPGHFGARLDLARIRYLAGDVETALADARTVHFEAGRRGSQFERMTAALLISQIAATGPNVDVAFEHARETIRLANWLGTPAFEGLAREQLGDMATLTGRREDALAQFNRGLELLRDACPVSARRLTAKVDALRAGEFST